MEYIFETIQKYHMIEPGMKVVTGISGGADSICLLYVLKEYQKKIPFELLAVHVEHGIRGEASLEDASFTEELCRRMGVPCQVVPVEVRMRAGCGTGQQEGRCKALSRWSVLSSSRMFCGAF